MKLHSGQLVVGRLTSPPVCAYDSDDVLLRQVPRKRKRLHDADDSARAAAETLMELGGSVATHRTVLPKSSCFGGILSSKLCCPFTVISGDSLLCSVPVALESSLGLVESDLGVVSLVKDCYSCDPVDEMAGSGSSTFIAVQRLCLRTVYISA